MKRFVLLSLLALLPALLVVAFYLIKDPFHVVKPYQGKVYDEGDTLSLTINWGHVTIESFKYFDPQAAKRYSAAEELDVFFLGNNLIATRLDFANHVGIGEQSLGFLLERKEVRFSALADVFHVERASCL